MTIAVIRGNVIAADGGLWEGESLVGDQAEKVIRCRHGAFVVIGYCVAAMVERKFNDLGPIPNRLDLPDETTVVLLRNDGLIGFYEKDLEHDPIRVPFYAFGSAAPVAIGALHMGATAEQAVEIAIKVGPWAAGKVMSVTVGPSQTDEHANRAIEDDPDNDLEVWDPDSLVKQAAFDASDLADNGVSFRDSADWRERRGLRKP
jgi:hypothetical protein